MNNESIGFDLDADVSKFKSALNEASELVESLAAALNGLSETKVTLDVNIKNTDFNSVFRRLNNEMKTSNKAAIELSEGFDKMFSGKAFQRGFQATFDNLNASLTATTKKLEDLFGTPDKMSNGKKVRGKRTSFTDSITKSISEAIQTGFSDGIENAFSNKNYGLKAKIERLFEEATEGLENSAPMLALQNLTTMQNQIKNGLPQAFTNQLCELKKLDPKFYDGLTAKDMLKFISVSGGFGDVGDNNLNKQGRHFSQSEWARKLGQEMAAEFVRQQKELAGANNIDVLNSFNDMLAKAIASIADAATKLENAANRSSELAEAKVKKAEAEADAANAKAEKARAEIVEEHNNAVKKREQDQQLAEQRVAEAEAKAERAKAQAEAAKIKGEAAANTEVAKQEKLAADTKLVAAKQDIAAARLRKMAIEEERALIKRKAAQYKKEEFDTARNHPLYGRNQAWVKKHPETEDWTLEDWNKEITRRKKIRNYSEQKFIDALRTGDLSTSYRLGRSPWTQFSSDPATAKAQRAYLQAQTHYLELINREANSFGTERASATVKSSAVNQMKKAASTVNNITLKDALGIKDLDKEIKQVKEEFGLWGSQVNKTANIIMNITQAMGQIQSLAHNITFSILNYARSITNQLANNIKSMVADATEAYKSLETSMIGFTNFFGEEKATALYQQIKQLAAVAPGLGTTDLAEYVRQIAPVSNGDANLALHASMGMLKTIQYGGAQGSTEMEYVIKNIRDVLSKGTATQIDIRQFNRAMPILEQVLEDIGESQLIKNGKLTIDKNNVDTILAAFAKLDTDQNSKVAAIFDTMNKTLSGQLEQLQEQFTTNLMTMLQKSGVYGRAQNLLSQFNAGEYAQTALIRFGNTLTNFVKNINWFKLQEAGKILWNGLNTIWGAIKQLVDEVKKELNNTTLKSIVTGGADALSGFIKSLARTVTQIITLIDRFVNSGLGKFILSISPAITVLLKFQTTILNFTQQITKAAGSWSQKISASLTQRLQNLKDERLEFLNSIPASVKEYGAITKNGIVEGADGSYQILQSSTEGAGTRILTMDKYGTITDTKNYADSKDARTAFSQIQKESTSGMKKFTATLQKGAIKALNAFSLALNGAMLTETVGSVIEGLNLFDDATATVAAGVKAAGLTITGAITGASLGGVAGGVVGALVGLGVGIVNLVKTINDERDKLTNTKFNEALTEGQKNILNAATEVFVGRGLLRKDPSERSEEESYALQQVAKVISSTGMSELQNKLEKDPNYLTRIFANNLANKTIAMNSTNQNQGKGFDWEDYKVVSGRGVNIQQDRETLGRMAKLIAKYDLAADQAWYRDDKGNYYYDKERTQAVSGEAIWKAYFGDQEISEKGIEKFEEYIAGQEDLYAPIKDVDTKTDAIKDSIQKLTGNKAETFLDNTTDKILDETYKANAYLARIANENPTSETNASMYANSSRSSEGIRENLDYIKERYNTGLYGFQAMKHKLGLTGGGMLDPNEIDSNAHYTADYNIEQIFNKVGRLSIDERVDEEGKGLANQMLNDIANGNYNMNGDATYYKQWINDWRKKLTKYFVQAGLTGFASGGSVLSRGIDTVPAMLAPGEFVMKQSAVRKAGLGVMYALNHGDLGMAARRLAGSVSNNWYRNNNAQINNSRNQKTNINNITINNRNASARMNSYYSLANRLSF